MGHSNAPSPNGPENSTPLRDGERVAVPHRRGIANGSPPVGVSDAVADDRRHFGDASAEPVRAARFPCCGSH